jgi:lactate dehydrogenase-like 2-hydroxyacid dehydrogenase
LPRVHVTGEVPERILAALREDFELVSEPRGADGVLSLITSQIDESFLSAAGGQLRVVANYGVGVNNVDLTAAAARGVTVTNTPDVLTETTAEFAVALMLALLRRVVEGDRRIRSRAPWSWSLEFMLGESIGGKRLAIVGPGRIGRATARLAASLGADPFFIGREDPLLDALAEADVVSLHCPLTPSTHHLIDARALRAMRADAVLVNTSRGPVVDEAALCDALEAGAISGAALDVFEFEPRVSERLLTMEHVVVTPHMGSGTRATREAMGMLAVAALRSVLLDGRRPDNAVAYTDEAEDERSETR